MATFYVSDLDGTLLRNDARLSEASKAALQRLIADGLSFSVASARSVVSMRPLLDGLDLLLPVIEFNGAFVSDLRTGHHEIVNAIDPAIVPEVFDLLQRSSRSVFVSTFNGAADRLYYSEITNQGEQHYVSNRRACSDSRLRCISDLKAILGERVVCMTVIGRPDPLEEMARAAGERFADVLEMHLFENQYSPGWFWLTIHDARATKDQAIQEIRQRYGLDGHDLVVFGDHVNDVRMFRLANQAVAVANAHPDVKGVATQLIGSNEEDSVVRFIEEHFARSA